VPDYRSEAVWAALPGRADAADFLPRSAPDTLLESNDSLGIDVYFVHPTLYERGRSWNAPLDQRRLNRRVDELPIRLQASAFAAGTRLYAPRYRQAHLGVFTWKDAESDRALDTAYADVRAAFVHYLTAWNAGRPFVLAGRGTGGLSWFIDGTPTALDDAGSPIWQPRQPGFYQVTAVDAEGRTSRVRVRVLTENPA
jgi:membrane carboxypeptidase/penicillin-binding protein PbpC